MPHQAHQGLNLVKVIVIIERTTTTASNLGNLRHPRGLLLRAAKLKRSDGSKSPLKMSLSWPHRAHAHACGARCAPMAGPQGRRYLLGQGPITNRSRVVPQDYPSCPGTVLRYSSAEVSIMVPAENNLHVVIVVGEGYGGFEMRLRCRRPTGGVRATKF